MTSPESRPAVFSPDTIITINRAYATALDILGPRAERVTLRTTMARHLIALAETGERDAERLSAEAVLRTLHQTDSIALR